MYSVYLFVRILHVLCGALWVGAALFSSLFLIPATRDLGLDGVKVVLALKKRGVVAYFPIVSGLTVLSGFWLYWRFTAGFSAEVSRTHAGMAFGAGGTLGLLAFIIGGAIVSRHLVAATRLGDEAAALPEGREKADRLARAGVLRTKSARAGQVAAVLVIGATILMTLARYI
jgi:hypothetical protein